ncbi:EexN family lipoprotein [Sphingobium sp. EP60837]|uniref:EexN family lipoprotein n=1 Tax=Sphingobium sp. EP60837 TaxID=1855519 RepID=UPI0007DD987B|nr:EexN family lipoprotein [Sphingobium sp. EP60837]ANI80396.1 hypothetical protein EP837_04018 [Sphingobium sp. EP60837]
MKATILKTCAFFVPAFLVACQPPARGKDYLKAHPQELVEVLKACADGTHRDAQECSNAESVKTLNQKLRSLSAAH